MLYLSLKKALVRQPPTCSSFIKSIAASTPLGINSFPRRTEGNSLHTVVLRKHVEALFLLD